MTPEYLCEMADKIDTERLWRLSPFAQLELPPEKRWRLDAGVALRRHAAHVREMRDLLLREKSLLLTPLSLHGSAHGHVSTPQKWRVQQADGAQRARAAQPEGGQGALYMAQEPAREIARLKAQVAELEAQRTEVWDMWICEATRLVLRIGQPYRFKVDPTCESCQAAAAQALAAYGESLGAPNTSDTSLENRE